MLMKISLPQSSRPPTITLQDRQGRLWLKRAFTTIKISTDPGAYITLPLSTVSKLLMRRATTRDRHTVTIKTWWPTKGRLLASRRTKMDRSTTLTFKTGRQMIRTAGISLSMNNIKRHWMGTQHRWLRTKIPKILFIKLNSPQCKDCRNLPNTAAITETRQ